MNETRPLRLPVATTSGKNGFRADINALRAIAALAVVLFHFDVPHVEGGFVGVDIFFVISGLLMTQIIETGIERGKFSILGFYAARVRRIVPAIAICCLVVTLVGVVLIDPLVLDETAQNALSTMLFYSNMRYGAQGGYFANTAETNWFLHSWTLSVEWQFYLAYPIILVLASRWKGLWRHRAVVTLLCCAILFVITMVIADHSTRLREWAFYLLPTRAWEMLAGGCLAFYRPRITGRMASGALALGGLAIILLSILLIGPGIAWPSWWMIFPVLGTLAVLAAQRQDLHWSSLPGMKTAGLWSYSLYLWHWPVIAALRYYDRPLDVLTITGGLLLCFILAGLSYTLVETRLRDFVFGPGKTASKQRWAAVLVGWLAMLGVVASATLTHGYFDLRTRSMTAQARAAMSDYSTAMGDWEGMPPCPLTFSGAMQCHFGTAGKGEPILVIGDSHTEQMIPRLRALGGTNRYDITLLRLQGCSPIPGTHWTGARSPCNDFAVKALDFAREHKFKRVVIFAAWAIYFANDATKGFRPDLWCEPGPLSCTPMTRSEQAWPMIERGFHLLGDELRMVRESGAETVLVMPQPNPAQGAPNDFYRQTFFTGNPVVPPAMEAAEFRSRTSHVRGLIEQAARTSGSKLIDPLDTQCPNGLCPVQDNGHYLFKDTHHIRASVVMTPQLRWFDKAVTGS